MSDDFVPERVVRVRPEMAATIAVLVANVIVFIFQGLAERLHPDFPVDAYFALSLEGLRHGFVWQLLTYQFMHGSLLHIFANSWAIFVFGRAVETTIGWRRMLTLYFLSGIAGGLVQMLGTWLLPGIFGNAAVIGASAGASGLMAAFAALYPRQVLYMLLYFVIPLKMRAMTMLWLWVATSLVGIFVPYGNVAHAAHLGGTAMGFLFARALIRNHRPPPPIIAPPPGKSPLHITPAGD